MNELWFVKHVKADVAFIALFADTDLSFQPLTFWVLVHKVVQAVSEYNESWSNQRIHPDSERTENSVFFFFYRFRWIT